LNFLLIFSKLLCASFVLFVLQSLFLSSIT